ncbi:hypothetical protein [Pantoea vagans]|uniref:hypothetical protein n=1 Tax=Pantoea vagans TaxID=470934 RepID=UPI0023B02453|nr:hypothetical protein [Pantoea vagans]MDE8556139.1 hypothetical protein [Pantoea vagans]MDE8576190.1 hypothetical protein [Pantoea vagans]
MKIMDNNLSAASEHRGKIGFIFPATRDKNGNAIPVLNIFSQSESISLLMCSAFMDLNAGSSYLVSMSLKSPSGVELMAANNLDGIPPEQIHPIARTTFLSAGLNFKASESGIYTYSCELIEMMQTTVDKKDIYFNILLDLDKHG